MMSVIQVFRRLFPFSVAFNIFKVIAFTKSQRLFMLTLCHGLASYDAMKQKVSALVWHHMMPCF